MFIKKILKKYNSYNDFKKMKYEDFKLINYKHFGTIKAKMNV
jgi:thymidylate synthase